MRTGAAIGTLRSVHQLTPYTGKLIGPRPRRCQPRAANDYWQR